MPAPTLWAGAMSGTSLDGVDAVVCAFDGPRFCGVVAHNFVAYPLPLRETLLALQGGEGRVSAHEWATLDQAIAGHYTDALRGALTEQPPISGIGMHGQTVFHDPVSLGNSLQIGNANYVAAMLGIPVVADFRRADIALGGQGAPLVPAFHAAVLGEPGRRLGVVNIGGIANLSIIEPDGTARGHDLGPGNGLMDEWIQTQRGLPWDDAGTWADQGHSLPEALAALLSDPWFASPPPRSTGRDQFRLAWAQARSPELNAGTAVDVQRTLLELTATLISDAARATQLEALYVCGGGARNAALMRQLSAQLPGLPVNSTAIRGLDPQHVEAAAFAWLAKERLEGRASGCPSVTGARIAAVQGAVYQPALSD